MRPARAGDLPAVLAFWASAAEDGHRPVDTEAALTSLLARDPHALILAEAGPALVGTIVAGWDGWRCHLYRLAVAPAHRGQGIGRRLVDAAERRFRELGGTRADAMVLDDNPQAHGLWRALGYAPQAAWSRWVKPLTPAPPNPDRQVLLHE
jgi:ribosomal protein S18 acetylase RimI-like enzyme